MGKLNGVKSILHGFANNCFYLGVIIEIFIVLIDKSSYTNPIEGRLFQITFLLFLIKVCLTDYTLGEYITVFVFCVLGAVSYFMTGRNEIIRVVMLVAACKNIDKDKCLKTVFWITLLGCIVIAMLSITGVYGDVLRIQDYGRGSIESRYVLGMGHPNALHCMVWAMITLGIYIYMDRLRWYSYLFLFLVNIFFFALTNSKTGFLGAAISIIGAWCFRYIPILKRNKIVKWLGISIVLGCVIISVMGAANAVLVREFYWERDLSANARFYALLDKFLTGRLHTLACTTNMEGTLGTWRLFSTPQSNYYFDLGWVRLFYWYGVIPGAIYVLLNVALMGFCYEKEDYMGFLMILSTAIYTVFEAHVISDYLARNYIFFLMGAYWYQMIPMTKGKGKRWNGKSFSLL